MTDKLNNQRADRGYEPLSPEEMKLLELLAARLRRKEIALTLMKGEETIKTQLRQIGDKLRVVGERSQENILARAIDLGLIGTDQAVATLRQSILESTQKYAREKEQVRQLVLEVQIRDEKLQLLEQEAQELSHIQETQLADLQESHHRILQYASDVSSMRRIVRRYQIGGAFAGFTLAIPLVLVIVTLGGYFWNFLFDRQPLPVTSQAYIRTERVVNNGAGSCIAWPLEIQERVYGPKLYFSSQVEIHEYDYAPYWLYFRGAFMYPIVVSLDGDSPEGHTVFGMRNFWAFYFPKARDIESWYLRYPCSPPEDDPAGETGLDPVINGWCTSNPVRIEKLESGDYFMYLSKETRIGLYPKHLFYFYYRDEYVNYPEIYIWQYNIKTEEWEIWIKKQLAKKHPDLTEFSNWRIDYVCAEPKEP